MTEKWYDITPDLLEKKLKTNFRAGLSVRDAASRLRRYGTNDIYPIPKGPFKLYLKHILTDFTSIMLIITAVLSTIYRNDASAVVMICLLLLNLGATVFTYVKAQRVLEGMSYNSLPNAKVMRGGRLYMVKQEQLVPGDIIFISAGDIVPADARLIESDSFTALEASLTGETHSSSKDANFTEYRDIPITARRNMIYAGTIVTSGTGRAIVCDTGIDTLICAMDKNTPVVSHEQLGVLSTLRRYCRVTSLCMIAMIFALTVVDLVTGYENRDLFEIFLTGMTLAVAAMSEFYTAFGYIIVSCGVFSAVKRYKDINSGALIKNTEKLEALKDLTCLIMPKEAMLSVRLSSIDKIYVNGESVEAAERGYNRKAASLLRYAVVSTGIYGGKKLLEDNRKSENVYSQEEDSILRAAEKAGVYNSELERMYPIIEHKPLSRNNRFETTLTAFSGGNVAVMRGDYIGVLGCCRYYSEGGRVKSMSTDKLNDLRITASQITKKAYRVIAIATRNTDYNDLTRIYACQSDMTFEGFICIREPLLAGAAINVEKCRAAGIKVIMTTSDVSDNNRYIAAALGIVKKDNEIVTGGRLANMRPGLFEANVPMYRLYQGINNDLERRVIDCLRENGDKVGILSKELDDIILLRDADVGFAQSVTISPKAGKDGLDLQEFALATDRSVPIYSGNPKAASRTGCEAVKFISDVIISEPDKNGSGGFNAMVGAISCSRVIYKNLIRALRYLLASQSARLLLVLYSILSGTPFFMPVQLLFSGLILDFGAVIVIAFERPANDILSQKVDAEEKLKKPLKHNIESILFGITWAAVTIASPILLRHIGVTLTEAQITSASFIGFILTQLAVLSITKRDRSMFTSLAFNGVHMLYIGVIALLLLFGQLLKDFGALFGIVRLPPVCMLTTVAFPLAAILLCELWRWIYKKLEPVRIRKKRGSYEKESIGEFFSSGFRVNDMDEDELYDEDMKTADSDSADIETDKDETIEAEEYVSTEEFENNSEDSKEADLL